MATAKTSTGSRKIDALVARAERAGLEVKVSVTDEAWGYRSVSLDITRPQVEAANLLDQIRNAEWISAGWGWSRGNGCTPKQTYARKYGLFGAGENLSASILPYAISGMGEY